jgi:1-carboxybiuret hydrolase subunit AtzG-like
MAKKAGTSRPKKAPRKARPKTKAKARTRPKPAAVAKSPTHDPLDNFIDAAARMLGLPLEPAWRPAVKANLVVTLRQAALVDEFTLPDDAEPAPVFRA